MRFFGYVRVLAPNHPTAHADGRVFEHVLMVETVLGKTLPRGAMVHHVNGQRSDNRNDNFVACQDNAYHKLLHQRERAFEACGHANWRSCPYCHQYDDPANMVVHQVLGEGRVDFRHRDCRNSYARTPEARKHRRARRTTR